MVLTIAPVPSSRVSHVKNKKTPKKAPAPHPTNQTPKSKNKRKWSYHSDDGSIFSEQFGTLGAVLRACARNAAGCRSMTTSSSSTTTSGGISFEVNCKISKVFFSVPRKCSECDRMLLFTAFACQFCRYRVHRRCAKFDDPETLRSCRNRCSLSKLPTDDKLFEKLIRENEINPSDMDVFLEECHHLLKTQSAEGLRHSFSSRTLIYSDSSDPDNAWSTRSSSQPPIRCRSSPITRCYSHSFSESWDSSTVSVPTGCLDAGYSSPPPPPVMMNRIWSLFTRAQAGEIDRAAAGDGKKASGASSSKTSTVSNGWATALSKSWATGASPAHINKPSITESDSGYPSDCGASFQAPLNAFPPNPFFQSKTPSPQTDQASKLRLPLTNSHPVSSNRSPLHSHSTPTRTPVDEFNDTVVSARSSRRNSAVTTNMDICRRSNWVRSMAGERGAHSEDSVTDHLTLARPSVDPDLTPCDLQNAQSLLLRKDSVVAVVSPEKKVKSRLSATWPLPGLHINYDEEIEEHELCKSVDNDSEHDTKSLGLGEWTIPFEELHLGPCIMDGRDTKVYAGDWHGKVMAHVFKTNSLKRTAEFKEEVHQLTKLRHENLVLFMGVCVEPPNLSVVTGAHCGDSLYQMLHVKEGKKISDHSKFSIARQVAQGERDRALYSDPKKADTSTAKTSSLECRIVEAQPRISKDQNLNINSKKLEDQPYFHGQVQREEVCDILKNHGDFIVRESINTKAEQPIVLSVLWNGKVKHFPVTHNAEKLKWQLGERLFATVPELVLYNFQNRKAIGKDAVQLLNPVPKDKYQLTHEEVVLLEQLGTGNFGAVYKGKLVRHEGSIAHETLVAVKVCKDDHITLEEKKSFLNEARTMKRYQHENVLSLIGICTTKDPIMIVTELMAGGGLDEYLRTNRGTVTVTEMTRFCVHAAAGMAYLAERDCIHRDLAARNCLLDEQRNLKISDFGLSRQGTEYARPPPKSPSATPGQSEANARINIAQHQLPIRWLAPEALTDHNFTSKSDVWSYGVLMFEIFTEMAVPYADLENSEIQKAICEDKVKLAPPPNMPKKLARIMGFCFADSPDARPGFKELRDKITEQYNHMLNTSGVTPAPSTP